MLGTVSRIQRCTIKQHYQRGQTLPTSHFTLQTAVHSPKRNSCRCQRFNEACPQAKSDQLGTVNSLTVNTAAHAANPWPHARGRILPNCLVTSQTAAYSLYCNSGCCQRFNEACPHARNHQLLVQRRKGEEHSPQVSLLRKRRHTRRSATAVAANASTRPALRPLSKLSRMLLAQALGQGRCRHTTMTATVTRSTQLYLPCRNSCRRRCCNRTCKQVLVLVKQDKQRIN